MTRAAPSSPCARGTAAGALHVPRRTVIRAALGLAAAAVLPPRVGAAADPVVPAPHTTWGLDKLPEIDALAPLVHATFQATGRTFRLDGRDVTGHLAGRNYHAVFVRDLATYQEASAFFNPPEALRTPVEAFLASQAHFAGDPATAGAVSAVIDPTGRYDKATAVSDEESSVVQAAYAYYQAYGGVEWLAQDISGRTVLDRLTGALAYLRRARALGGTELLFRAHTTDWGDAKVGPGPEPTDLAPGDALTVSPYDQAWHYRALHDLAAMLRAAGRPEPAEALLAQAALLRQQARDLLWLADRGYYRIHAHLSDWVDPFDLTQTIAISNVLALYAGLATPDQVEPIFSAVALAAQRAGTDRAGLTLDPPFPAGFFQSRSMTPGEYQNGGVWDWWGGLQIVSEFEHGRAEAALAHLQAVGRAWQASGGPYEWFHLPSRSPQGSPDFTGAAATVAQAVIRGLFGVRLSTRGFSLTPRLGARSGMLAAIRPGGGRLAVTQTAYPSLLFLDYEVDAGLRGAASVRLPAGWASVVAYLDGRPLPVTVWAAGRDTYAGTWQVPGGAHTLIVARVD